MDVETCNQVRLVEERSLEMGASAGNTKTMKKHRKSGKIIGIEL